MLRKQVSIFVLFVFLGGCATIKNFFDDPAPLLYSAKQTWQAVREQTILARANGAIPDDKWKKFVEIDSQIFAYYKIVLDNYLTGKSTPPDMVTQINTLIEQARVVTKGGTL